MSRMSFHKLRKMSYKDWCFTINNWEQGDKTGAPLQAILDELKEVCSYFVVGKEKGDSGTPHLQGFLQLKTRTTLKNLKRKMVFKRAHLEKRRASPQEAAQYCKKDGDFEEFGAISFQGKRNDLDEIKATVKTGGLRAVAENYSYQHIRYAEKYLQYAGEKRNWQPLVIWIHGATGLGKSRAARQITSNPFVKNECSKWFHGYDGERHVIFDDFDDTWMPYQDCLSLLDRYERVVEVKCGQRQFLAERIVITSQHPPSAYYGGSGSISQLMRRVTAVHFLENEDDWLDVCLKWPVAKDDVVDLTADDDDKDSSGEETPEEELRAKRKKIDLNKND